MGRRTVGDVMSREVVTASVHTGYTDLVEMLVDNGISAVPVVDHAGRVLGVVSEADLIAKESARAEGATWSVPVLWRRHRDRARADGDTAGELMSEPAVTVRASASLASAARLMSDRRVKRMPVVDDEGLLRGIVSRRDVLGVFLRPDEEIAAEIRVEVFERSLDTAPDRVRVLVREGRVELDGEVERRSWARIADALVERVDGVVSVVNRLTWSWDDSGITIPEAMVVDIRHEPRR